MATYKINYYDENGVLKYTETRTSGGGAALTTYSTAIGTLSGWSFYGWATSTNTPTRTYTDKQVAAFTAATTNLYAIRYKPDSWNGCTWYSGGSGTTTEKTAQYLYGNGTTATYRVTVPSSPASISGWTAVGWAKGSSSKYADALSSPNPGQSYTSTSPINAMVAVYKLADGVTCYYGKSKASSVKTYKNYIAHTTPHRYIYCPSITSSLGSDWTFKGWTSSTSASSSYTAAKGYIEDTSSSVSTIYAEYSRSIAAFYDGNDATGGSMDTTSTTQWYNSYNTINPTSVTLAANKFTKTGYTFSKWAYNSTSGTQYSAGSTGYPYNIGASNYQTYYAIWSANKYTITYKANGGVGDDVVQTNTYGTSFTVKNNPFTRTGYTFTGWNTKADGTGTEWTPGSTAVYQWTSNFTLYAQWEPNTYTITYKANGGVGDDFTQSVQYKKTVIYEQNRFTRTGYTFWYWNTEPDGSGTSYGAGQGGSYDTLGNTTLYAIWKSEDSSILVKRNGSWVRAKMMCKVDGEWKSVKPFVEISGQWKS